MILINKFLFRLFFYKRIKRNSLSVLSSFENERFTFRHVIEEDLETLFDFLHDQNPEQFKYFKPHSFEKHSLKRLFKNPSNLLFGVFDQNKLIGYFFLRCFINKKCFTGRFVEKRYQNQGIGKKMGKILLAIAWSSNFRIFGTASKENMKSLKSYQAINNYHILSELKNNYIFFEFLRPEEKPFL